MIKIEYFNQHKNKDPNTCPICKEKINPKLIAINEIYKSGIQILVEWVYLCNNNDCNRYFIACYKQRYPTLELILARTYVTLFSQKEKIDEIITNISEKFVNIYNQSLEAEINNLDQIAWMWYRKAIWIWNDETHYIRKWKDKDINDLKSLIKISMHRIIVEEEWKKYNKEMK